MVAIFPESKTRDVLMKETELDGLIFLMKNWPVYISCERLTSE